MEEWHHARFLTDLDIMYWCVPCFILPDCIIRRGGSPYKTCGEAFDLNDVASPLGLETAKSVVHVSSSLCCLLCTLAQYYFSARAAASLLKDCKVPLVHFRSRVVFCVFKFQC